MGQMATLNLYLESPPLPPRRDKQELLLFFKLFDPVAGQLRYGGHALLHKESKVQVGGWVVGVVGGWVGGWWARAAAQGEQGPGGWGVGGRVGVLRCPTAPPLTRARATLCRDAHTHTPHRHIHPAHARNRSSTL